MTVSYIIGKNDPFRCDVLHLLLFPVYISLYTFVMLSVEKFIAIKFALRYKTLVTHCRVYQVIAAGWIIVPLFRLTGFIYDLIVDAEYDKYILGLISVFLNRPPLLLILSEWCFPFGFLYNNHAGHLLVH